MDTPTEMEGNLLDRLNADLAAASFPELLGLRFVAASPNAVEARLTVTDILLNGKGIMHGGAVMTLADTLGGFATRINLGEGQGTTTIESKTNFFRAARSGSTLRARAEALHKGKTTMVWQTTIEDETGAKVAVTTQTQMILTRK